MVPKPVGTDLPTMASLQNARRTKHLNTWRHAAKNGPNRVPKPIGSITPILLEADYASWTSTGTNTMAPEEFWKLNSQDRRQPLTWASLITNRWGAPTLWSLQSVTLFPPHPTQAYRPPLRTKPETFISCQVKYSKNPRPASQQWSDTSSWASCNTEMQGNKYIEPIKLFDHEIPDQAGETHEGHILTPAHRHNEVAMLEDFSEFSRIQCMIPSSHRLQLIKLRLLRYSVQWQAQTGQGKLHLCMTSQQQAAKQGAV